MKKTSSPKSKDMVKISEPSLRFLEITNQFIDTFYPLNKKIESNSVSTFIINAVAYTDNVIISVLTYSNLQMLKSLIKSDIQKLKESKYPSSFIIYLISDNSLLSREQCSELCLDLSSNPYHILIHTEDTIINTLINSYKPPVHINNNYLNSFYDQLYNVPKIEENIIEEIFSFLHSDSKQVVKIKPIDTHFSNLKEKLLENFHKNYYTGLSSCYRIHWSNKECVEHFVINNFSEFENQLYGLLEKIQTYFSSAHFNHDGVFNAPVNNPDFFDELTLCILPSDKHTDFRFTNTAKAIVLFFFEYCDFGKKAENDPQTLFPKLFGDDDTAK